MADNKLVILAGISAAAGYFGHEVGHQVLGSTAYAQVSIVLGVLAFVGAYLQEITFEDTVGEFALKVAGISGVSFGAVHQITHTQFLNLSQASLFLALIAGGGIFLYEDFVGRFDFITGD